MKFLNIPAGTSNFEEIRRDGFYYIDKTGLIGERSEEHTSELQSRI